jgi:hypothetical protein
VTSPRADHGWQDIVLGRRACPALHDYMTGMDKKRELRSHWQRACKLILAKEDVVAVSRALELALFMDAKLDVSKVPAE